MHCLISELILSEYSSENDFPTFSFDEHISPFIKDCDHSLIFDPSVKFALQFREWDACQWVCNDYLECGFYTTLFYKHNPKRALPLHVLCFLCKTVKQNKITFAFCLALGFFFFCSSSYYLIQFPFLSTTAVSAAAVTSQSEAMSPLRDCPVIFYTFPAPLANTSGYNNLQVSPILFI